MVQMFLFCMCFYCSQDRITRQLIASASAFNPEGSRIESWNLGWKEEILKSVFRIKRAHRAKTGLPNIELIPPLPNHGGHLSPAFRGGPKRSSPCHASTSQPSFNIDVKGPSESNSLKKIAFDIMFFYIKIIFLQFFSVGLRESTFSTHL